MKQLNVEKNVMFLILNALHKNQHNHIQNFVDRTKINKEVKDSLKAKIEKNYTFADVHKNAQDTHRKINVVVLKIANESTLILQKMYNSDFEYFRQNRNFRKEKTENE